MKKGDTVTVYEDPLTQQSPAFQATLLRRTAKNLGMHEGKPLWRWLVLPVGEGQEKVEVTILEP